MTVFITNCKRNRLFLLVISVSNSIYRTTSICFENFWWNKSSDVSWLFMIACGSCKIKSKQAYLMVLSPVVSEFFVHLLQFSATVYCPTLRLIYSLQSISFCKKIPKCFKLVTNLFWIFVAKDIYNRSFPRLCQVPFQTFWQPDSDFWFS